MARNFADEPFVGQLKLSLPPLNAKAVPLMTADQVNKVPPPLLSWIWSVASQVQDLDEITIVTVADESCHPKIQWVIQWILHGEEASFFARGKSEVVRMDDKNNRRVVSYDSETHARDVGWRATAETHAWFEELAEVYQFSVFAGLTDLRAALSERLCSRFPVYVPEIITFFKKLYDNDVFTPFDAELGRFVANRVETLQKLASRDDNLLDFLRTRLPARDRLQALLSHLQPDSDAIAAAAKSLSDNAGRKNESSALLAAFMERYLKISDPIPTAPTGPAARRPSDYLNGDAMFIFDAIYRDRRLVVAEQAGRGTLLSTRCGAETLTSVDNGFSVVRGELLVVLSILTTSESNKATHVVCNRHGDVGEMFQELRLTPIQDNHHYGDFVIKNDRLAPPSPASENDKKNGGKKRRYDSWRPSV